MKKQIFKVQLLRHATLVMYAGDKKILVDPFLSDKSALDPVGNAGNDTRIPMVDLPINREELSKILNEVDAVLVSHTHRDHWDVAAQQKIDKSKLILCQPEDVATIKAQGFLNVQPLDSMYELNDVKIYRTGGQHGTGEIGKKMGKVSGFVIQHHNETLYIAGDTILCQEVEDAIQQYKPSKIIINGGGAKFLHGDAITMTTQDVSTLTQITSSNVYVVHLETVNHCNEKRNDFKKLGIKKLFVPNDGEWFI